MNDWEEEVDYYRRLGHHQTKPQPLSNIHNVDEAIAEIDLSPVEELTPPVGQLPTRGKGDEQNPTIQFRCNPVDLRALHDYMDSGCDPQFGHNVSAYCRNALFSKVSQDRLRHENGEFARMYAANLAGRQLEQFVKEADNQLTTIIDSEKLAEKFVSRNDKTGKRLLGQRLEAFLINALTDDIRDKAMEIIRRLNR